MRDSICRAGGLCPGGFHWPSVGRIAQNLYSGKPAQTAPVIRRSWSATERPVTHLVQRDRQLTKGSDVELAQRACGSFRRKGRRESGGDYVAQEVIGPRGRSDGCVETSTIGVCRRALPYFEMGGGGGENRTPVRRNQRQRAFMLFPGSFLSRHRNLERTKMRRRPV